MQKIIIARQDVNIERLDEDLSQIAGYEGCSLNSEGVVIYIEENTPTTAFRDAVNAHSQSDLSTRQQERDALRAEIVSLKQSIGNINTLTDTEQTDAIKLLYKVLKLNELI